MNKFLISNFLTVLILSFFVACSTTKNITKITKQEVHEKIDVKQQTVQEPKDSTKDITQVPKVKEIVLETGFASWYGPKYHGRLTASGETFDQYGLTAAHKTLPFNTIVKVVNKSNNKSVTVRINDRGPFVKGRIIDLSRKAAQQIGIIKKGFEEVDVYIINN